MIDWLGAHRDHVGVVVVDDGEEVVAHQPDEKFALASTIKVLTLLAYAELVASGGVDAGARVTVEELDRYYLPGTDGGAHDNARAEWGDAQVISLDQVVRAMIRYSSNAATDVVLDRVGGPTAVLAVATKHGMRRQDPPVVTYDMFRQWAGRESQVRSLASASPAGTPREWAALLDRVVRGRGVSPAAAAVARRHLEWPLELGENSRRYERLGTKGGSLPGIITEATYLMEHGRSPVSVALFLRNLPDDVERSLRRSFVHQQLMRELATQPEVRQRLADALST